MQSIRNTVRNQRRKRVLFLEKYKIQRRNEKKTKKKIRQYHKHRYKKDHKRRTIVINHLKEVQFFSPKKQRKPVPNKQKIRINVIIRTLIDFILQLTKVKRQEIQANHKKGQKHKETQEAQAKK